jgi:outer membrane protein TolC
VITAQSAALSDERTAVELSGRRMTDSVLLIKALGGGWTTASLPSVQNLAQSNSSANPPKAP